MIHQLKTWPEFFEHLWTGRKTFEIRKNDRNFRPGDQLLLDEYCRDKRRYTGRQAEATVALVIHEAPGLMKGHVVMSINVFNRILGAK